MRRFEFVDNMEMFVARRKVLVDEFGNRKIFLVWTKQKEPLEIGSIKEPKNQDVVSVKWDTRRGDFGEAIRKIFDGFKSDGAIFDG